MGKVLQMIPSVSSSVQPPPGVPSEPSRSRAASRGRRERPRSTPITHGLEDDLDISAPCYRIQTEIVSSAVVTDVFIDGHVAA